MTSLEINYKKIPLNIRIFFSVKCTKGSLKFKIYFQKIKGAFEHKKQKFKVKLFLGSFENI